MSVTYMGMAFKTDMPPVRKFVLVAMCDMANDADHGLTYPSIATIARHCSVDRRTVERAIKELEAEDYLTADRRPGMKSRYRINLEKLNQAHADYMAERGVNLRQKVAGDKESQAAESRNTYGKESHPPAAESRNTCGRESHITRKNQKSEPEGKQNMLARGAPLFECPPSLDDVIAAFRNHKTGQAMVETEAPALFDWYQSIDWHWRDGQPAYSLDDLVESWVEQPET